MAHCRYLNIKEYQTGMVLIPVLLFTSIVTIGIIILLQSHALQKKSVTDFKFFLEERKKQQQAHQYYHSLNTNILLKTKTLKLIQKIPANLHYQNTNYHYYFQGNQQKYVYKLNQTESLENQTTDLVILSRSTEFNYQDALIKIIQTAESNQAVFYLYDINNDKTLFKTRFEQPVLYQLVGNPVNRIYISNLAGLYKIDLNLSEEQIKLKLLKTFDLGLNFKHTHFAPLVTRDARGDGRLITIHNAHQDEKLMYHEPADNKDDFLDLFEHISLLR